MVPPRPAPRRHLMRRPRSCRRSRRRRSPGRPNRGPRRDPAPRGCPGRRVPRPLRPTSAARAGARGRAVPGPRRRVRLRRAMASAASAPAPPEAVRIRATRVPGRPRPGRRDLVLPVPGRPGPALRVDGPVPRVPAPGPVTTRTARPRRAWVPRLRRGPRARARRAGKAVPAPPAVPPAGPVRADAVLAGPRVPAYPMAVRDPAGSRVRDPAAPGRAR
jgi:hypothetical protein